MPSCTWQVKTDKKEVFLTFDDGPIPEVTEWVLDTLAKHQIPATFFCVGDNIRKHPDIFKKVVAAGHSVGNHTFNHLKGWRTPNQQYFENVEEWESIVKRTGVQLPNQPLFRPPYGQISFPQAKKLGKTYQIVMWDIITGDFDKSLDKVNCLVKSVKMTKAGTVIVFHDSVKAKENLQFILPRYIEELKAKGFGFSKL